MKISAASLLLFATVIGAAAIPAKRASDDVSVDMNDNCVTTWGSFCKRDPEPEPAPEPVAEPEPDDVYSSKAVSGMSCKRDPEPEPAPEPDDVYSCKAVSDSHRSGYKHHDGRGWEQKREPSRPNSDPNEEAGEVNSIRGDAPFLIRFIGSFRQNSNARVSELLVDDNGESLINQP
ncbi:uncharacterized protein Z518_04985 [Rhinocladiella mackenziei CBS 650.93]|uniref:Uncharacterized protein n=1 Tax=Rhinocladiella mackenziei CBS 650.93 TaxID=1442369 RepID=A0A0D2IMN6_9EURO|nr:uncharacterized protein Z518_04985 [Rhinocladiella mackenziei CBS 650.93]KIX07009.1 hypothetical protein Z518_04985 [Rhinocladiella mackenziei CBS 650.93]